MGELPFALRDKVGVARDYAIGRNRYIGYLISLATRSYDGMRVGLDCSNGSTFNIAKSVFDALGAKTYVVGNEPDGTNINMGCGSTHIENLQRLVREKNLDCGFAFDGDADRCIAVDENGMEVHGDYILYVCGKYLKGCGRLQNNTVVATIMSNMGLFKAMKREGIEVCVTTVGDKYVNEAMVANGYVLGGEQSGHIIFSKHATTGDGILTALMLMEVIPEKKHSLGTLCKGMQMYPQLLKNVKVEDKAAVTGNARVQAEKDRISTALGEDGRILLRESGTEPVIRVMVEAQSDELCAKYVDEMVQVIREEGLAVEGAPPGMQPEQQVLETLGEEELTGMILNLREPYCTPCRLVLLEQHTMVEAARLCGRPPKTVEAQVYRAKKMLAQQILQNDRIPCERRSVHGTV